MVRLIQPLARIVLLLALALIVLVAVGGRSAQAAEFTVTKTADTADGTCDDDCSLREAVGAANAAVGADTISLPAGTYTLSIAGADEDANATGDLDVTDELTITGAGSATTTIDGGGIDRVLDLPSGGDLTLNDLTVTGGDTTGATSDDGAGVDILGEGSLTLNNAAVDGNVSIDDGGGVFACCEDASFTITNSTVSNNVADGDGGGLFHCCADLTLTITNSEISNNQASTEADGGGIFSCCGDDAPDDTDPTTITIVNSSIDNNDAPDGDGGGLSYCCGGTESTTLSISGSTMNGNTSGGDGGGFFYCCGSAAADTIDITDSAFSDNAATGDGGGIFLCCAADLGTAVAVTGSELAGNTSGGDGGGISLGATEASVINSTISGNTASGFGGGIENTDETALSLTNVTINGNTAPADSGGGLSVDLTTTASLLNTIIANNSSEDCLFETGLTSLGHNLDSDDTCGLTAEGDQPNTDPLLDPLALNAPGATRTHALTADSPALDAGDDVDCPATDQRGVERPQDGDEGGAGTAVCDIGAYELVPDADNDGVLDAFDACVNDPEDFDGIEDTDGCPEAPVQPTPTPAQLPETGGAPASGVAEHERLQLDQRLEI